MLKLPKELLDLVFRNIPPFSTADANYAWDSSHGERQTVHEAWKAIFKSTEWIDTVVLEYQGQPCLIGADLEDFRRPVTHRKELHLVLHSGIWPSDSRGDEELLFQCLQDDYERKGDFKVYFPKLRLTINFQEPLEGPEWIHLDSKWLRKLLNSNHGTSYCFFDSDRVHLLGPENVIGVGGSLSKFQTVLPCKLYNSWLNWRAWKAIRFGYALNATSGQGRKRQFVFHRQKDDTPALQVASREGSGSFPQPISAFRRVKYTSS